jgi:hypothetical protein
MIEPTSSTTQTQPVAPPTGAPTQKSTKAHSHASGDSVEFSKAAQASLAALAGKTLTLAIPADKAQ